MVLISKVIPPCLRIQKLFLNFKVCFLFCFFYETFAFLAHDVRNGERAKYLDMYKNYANEVTKATPGNELIGSWNVLFGNQDQTVHLWRYDNGYHDVDKYICLLCT